MLSVARVVMAFITEFPASPLNNAGFFIPAMFWIEYACIQNKYVFIAFLFYLRNEYFIYF